MSKHDDISGDFSKDFIDQLSKNLKPVHVKSLRFLAAQYFITLLALSGLFISFLGLADVTALRMCRSDVLVSLLAFALNISIGSFLLAQYSRPGVALSRKSHIFFFSVLGAALLIQIFRFVSGTEAMAWGAPIDQGWTCSITALVMSGIAASILIFELRCEAPVKLQMAALFLLLSAGAMAALVLQIHCSNENPIHQILWHIVLPLGVFALSAKTMSRLTLRW